MSEKPVLNSAVTKSRRHVLALAAAGSAAALASLVPRSRASAQGRQPLYVGEENPGTGTATGLTDAIADDFLLRLRNDDGGVVRITKGGANALFNPDNPPALVAESQTSGALFAAASEAPAIEASGGPTSPAIMGFGGLVGFGHMRAEDLPPGQPPGPGEGVIGQSEQPDKAGVLGESLFRINRGEEGQPPPSGIGVLGRSGTGTGVRGESQSGPAVEGWSGTGIGVQGFSQGPQGGEEGPDNTGVLGWGANGVFGFRPGNADGLGAGVSGAAAGTAPGVLAVSGTPTPPDPPLEGFWNPEGPSQIEPDGGVALRVEGKSLFSTAGNGAIPAGQNSVFVENAAVTAASHITVTLVGDPGPRHLRWVARDTGSGFTVHLASGPSGQRSQVPFTYLIVEPATGEPS